MKRLIMMLLCIFLLAGSAQAVTIEGMTLYGGNGATFGSWGWNSQGWTTNNTGWWVLGVSSNPGSSPTYGPLLNQSNTTITGLSFGNYYLYAEPTDLGNNPQLNVNLSDSTIIAAIFQLQGAPGSGTAWTWTNGDSAITLGWASGIADLVGSGNSMVPSGTNDFYLKAGIHAVPLPGAVWLLGTGLVGLAGLRRRFGR
jgi:hypothetical protein